jgi:2-C-methyl-D-erythritol 4-phosphate cytidylyltransferase
MMMTKTVGILLAAGKSTRFGGGSLKQMAYINDNYDNSNVPLYMYSVNAMLPVVDHLIIVCNTASAIAHVEKPNPRISYVINDNGERHDSIKMGIMAIPTVFDLSADPDPIILCHDSARPFVTTEHFSKLLLHLHTTPTPTPTHAPNAPPTVYAQYYTKIMGGLVDMSGDEPKFVNRDHYIEVCTPFCIKYTWAYKILTTHDVVYEFIPFLIDDASANPNAYKFCEGEPAVFKKITYASDIV